MNKKSAWLKKVPAMKSSQNQGQASSMWDRLYVIKHDDPELNSDTWCSVQPCRKLKFIGREILITQPSSTFWVYLLSLLGIVIGGHFIASHENQVSRIMWGGSLVLWGVGAFVAGSSYQAFGYQLKCAHRPYVVWTNWWEIFYLILQQLSISMLLVAVAYSCLAESGQAVSIATSALVSSAYILIVFLGAIKPVKSLITFELMVHICTPFIIFLIGLNALRYWQHGKLLDLALLGTWFGLVLTMCLYHLYKTSGLTKKLWKKGKWFSENDVLHVALIIWLTYIALVIEPLIKDISS